MNDQVRIVILEKSIELIQLITIDLNKSKRNHFAIDFYTDDTEAFQVCLTNAYDVIIMGDIVDDNLSFLYKLIDYGCKTSIIFLGEDDLMTNDALKNGASDYLIKKEITLGILERSIMYCVELSKIKYDAEHDKLTGLVNRDNFLHRLNETIEKSHQDKQFTYGVLFIDVDGFKYVNDTLGHITGDKLLISISEKIQECFHRLDLVCRYGGDEFAVLLSGMSKESIEACANKIKKSFQKSMFVEGYEFNNTVSVGVVIGQGDSYKTAQQIIGDADIAMYFNKNKEKDKPIIFDSNMRKNLERRYNLEHKLRKAIQKDEFNVHYQPIVSIKDNKILSLEALLRWKSDDSLIPPDEFIPIAEELFLIHNISEIVLQKTIRDMKTWKFPYFISTSINISPKQLSNSSIVDMFIDNMKNIEKDRIVIEITESSLINGNRKKCEENIRKFKESGFKIHLDDFGTGYSALGHIINFPLDAIKIDKSFIVGIENNKIALNVIKTIIDLAHNLGLYVIAEGVEQEAQRLLLETINCDYYQGYLYSKPVPSTEIAKIFRSLS